MSIKLNKLIYMTIQFSFQPLPGGGGGGGFPPPGGLAGERYKHFSKSFMSNSFEYKLIIAPENIVLRIKTIVNDFISNNIIYAVCTAV